MGRGTKLDLSFGADWGEGWAQVEEAQTHETPLMMEPAKHQLVFKKEKRRGKPVTLVGPLHVKDDDAKAVLGRLKKQLGAGGTYKEGWMEFQGDAQQRLRELFEAEGFRFRK